MNCSDQTPVPSSFNPGRTWPECLSIPNSLSFYSYLGIPLYHLPSPSYYYYFTLGTKKTCYPLNARSPWSLFTSLSRYSVLVLPSLRLYHFPSFISYSVHYEIILLLFVTVVHGFPLLWNVSLYVYTIMYFSFRLRIFWVFEFFFVVAAAYVKVYLRYVMWKASYLKNCRHFYDYHPCYEVLSFLKAGIWSYASHPALPTLHKIDNKYLFHWVKFCFLLFMLHPLENLAFCKL